MNSKLNKHPLVISALFSLIGMIIVGQIYLPVSILPKISSEFNVDDSMSGMVSSSFSIGYAAGFLIFGILSDKLGQKRVLLIGLILFSLMTLITGFCTNFDCLILFRILQGFFASCYPPVILSYLNQNLATIWRAKAIALVSLGFLITSIIAQLYAISMEHYGFNIIQLSLLPLYLLSIIIIYYYLDNNKQNTKNTNSVLSICKTIPILLFKIRYLYICSLCTLSALVAFYVLLDNNYNVELSSKSISLFTIECIVLPIMFFSLFSATLIKKIGAITLIKWSYIFASIGLIFASLFVIKDNLFGLLISIMLFIGARSFSVPSLISAITAQSPPQYTGTAISLYTTILFLGASMGPIIGRWLSIFNYSTSLLILAVFAGLPVLFTSLIKRSN